MNTIHIAANTGGGSWWLPVGTPGRPYDCSTREKFEKFLRLVDPYSTIHMAPGEYLLGPSGANSPDAQWNPKPLIMKGSGMSNTVIRMVGCTKPGRQCLFSDHYRTNLDGAEWHDMTLDLDMDGQVVKELCLQGLSVSGSDMLIRNVRVRGWGTRIKGAECFPLQVFGFGDTTIKRNVIDGCVVDRPCWTDNLDGYSAITISPATENCRADYSNVIRNCTVVGVEAAPRYGHAFGAPVVENNTCFGVRNGIYADYWAHTGWIYRNNLIFGTIHPAIGHDYTGKTMWRHGNILVENNYISMRTDNAVNYTRGIRFLGPEDPKVYGSVIVRNNVIEFNGSNGYGSELHAIAVQSAKETFIEGNIILP